MKKNAFTLVELLAVILILTIISLIVVPQVLKLINNSKEKSLEIGVQNYIRAIETAARKKDLDIEKKNLNGIYTVVNGGKKIQSSDNVIDIDYDGKEIILGKVTIKNYKVIALGVEQDNNYIIYENGEIVYNGKKQSPVSFSDDSWETITLNVKVGNLSKYNVGARKEVSLQPEFTNQESDSNGLYTVRIANTSTPYECNNEDFSQTACGFVIEFEDIITEHNMNPKGEYKGTQYDLGWNVDGYPASSMYAYIKSDIYNSLPEDLKEVIIDTKVVSSHGSTIGETNFISTDKLYLLSSKEVYGSNPRGYDTSADQTRQLDYYGERGVTITDYAEAIKKYNSYAKIWWLRSSSSNSTYTFFSVMINGGWSTYITYNSWGVAPSFRIG